VPGDLRGTITFTSQTVHGGWAKRNLACCTAGGASEIIALKAVAPMVTNQAPTPAKAASRFTSLRNTRSFLVPITEWSVSGSTTWTSRGNHLTDEASIFFKVALIWCKRAAGARSSMKRLLVRPRASVSSIRACPWACEVNSNSYWSDQAGLLSRGQDRPGQLAS